MTRTAIQCANPKCSRTFTPRRDDHTACSPACRTAAWKARRGYSDPRRARVEREPSRNASSAVRRKVSGPQVPYRRLVAGLTEALSHDPTSRAIALEVARASLPDRQRQRLEART